MRQEFAAGITNQQGVSPVVRQHQRGTIRRGVGVQGEQDSLVPDFQGVVGLAGLGSREQQGGEGGRTQGVLHKEPPEGVSQTGRKKISTKTRHAGRTAHQAGQCAVFPSDR